MMLRSNPSRSLWFGVVGTLEGDKRQKMVEQRSARTNQDRQEEVGAKLLSVSYLP